DPENPDKVYKVVKELYGLHQSPRAWYETLATYLLENRFQRGIIDKTLFIKKQQKDILLAKKQVEIYHLDLDHPSKVLSMQEDDSEVQEVVEVVTTAKLITEVVTAATSQVSAASATISAAKPSIPAAALTVVAAYTRRIKGVIIKDPEEELSFKTPAETPKLKDKGKGILIETPKPMKKKDQIKLDAEYARKLHEEINKDIDWDAAIDHTESEARKNMMVYLKNTAGYKLDFFKGMSYDEIRPIFQARFDANMRFLLKSREKMEEEDQEVLKTINETPAQKAAKRRKLNEEAQEVEDLKKHLEVVNDEDDDVFTEATPLARKVPVVDYQIVLINNKPRFKIIKADETHGQDAVWKSQKSVYGLTLLLELMLSKRSRKNTKCVNAADEELAAAKHKVAEMRIRTLIKAARTTPANSKLATTFWAEAVNTACYVQNKVLVVKPHNKIPYKLFHGRTPALSFMRPFGCLVTILNTKDHLGKFDGKADEGFFIRYLLNSKAFRVFNSRTRIAEENLHIRFSENTPNIAKSGINWLFDIDAQTKPIITKNQCNGNAGTKACDDTDKEKEDNVNNTNNVNVVGTNGVNAVSANTNNELPFDPEMPELEYISIFTFSNKDEDDGAEAGMNNLDTTIQMDVKSTFLFGMIKEKVYVCQPLGFKDLDFPDKVYKVEKALYGLHQAPRAWYLKCHFKLGIWYPKDYPFDLVAYTDSDYAGASLVRKSTTGGCQYLGCRLISWQCKKQIVIANSITEAEYLAASCCCGQVL
nr:hypothetical protein [Tanacetum cinerariifolium]